MEKKYHLIGADSKPYDSEEPGASVSISIDEKIVKMFH